MLFQTPLVPARLIRRYKRFLADCRLETGEEITAHCPNPGSMKGLAEPGARIWLEPNDDPRRKLRYGWRLVEQGEGHFVGIDTGAANRIVGDALRAGRIDALAGYDQIKAEVRFGQKSRVDFLLSAAGRPDSYVEVKSVTLCRQQHLAEFPDSVTARGTKHLAELASMVRQGHRAVMLYLVQRTDCGQVAVAADIDPGYAAAFSDACAQGVEAIAYSTRMSPQETRLDVQLEVARSAVI